jgi:glycosyltransferase involved in cell wall biosynthesis
MTGEPKQGFHGPIAYLTGEYPRATDTFIQREVAALRAQGIEVITCSIRRTGAEHLVGPEQRSEAQSTFHVIAAAARPLNFIRCHLGALVRAPARYFRALGLALRTGAGGARAQVYQLIYFAEAVVLADYLRRRGVTHLHNHIATASCTVAMLTQEISAIPFSFTIHGPGIFFEPTIWRIDEKLARARFVVCISEFCRSQAMIFCDPDHWSKLHIVHCAVEPARYGAADDRPAKRHDPRLLFIGRLAGVKGLTVLFAALEQLLPEFPQMRLTLIGDGPERAQMEREAKARGLEKVVAFAGYKSQDEVAAILRESDVLVLPSFAEGVPVVLMEAMASGIPVVATRIAGIPELVEDGVAGLLVSPGDETALAQAMARLLNDPALCSRMGQAGQNKIIADFNLEKEAKWLAELFEAYAGDGKRPEKRALKKNTPGALDPTGRDEGQ